MCLLPDALLLCLWFVRFVDLMRADHTTFLVSNLVAAAPLEAFGPLVEKIVVNGTMTVLVPVIPSAAVPIDFEFACISSACLSLFTYHYCIYL